jgi:hypothetical protein
MIFGKASYTSLTVAGSNIDAVTSMDLRKLKSVDFNNGERANQETAEGYNINPSGYKI